MLSIKFKYYMISVILIIDYFYIINNFLLIYSNIIYILQCVVIRII